MVYPATDVEHTMSASTISLRSLVQVDFSAAIKWEKLKQANFKLNGLKRIDESMVRVDGGEERERERERERKRESEGKVHEEQFLNPRHQPIFGYCGC